MLSKLKSGKCWTRLASYPLQYGNWPWWNNPAICKASPEENETGQYLEPHGKFRVVVKIHQNSLEFSILDAFYGFKKIWFFHCSPPHSFQSEKYRLTWNGKCEKFSVLFSNSSPEGVLQISSDRDDRMGEKIKTQKNSLGFKQNPKKSLDQNYSPKNPVPNFRAIIKISRKHKMI